MKSLNFFIIVVLILSIYSCSEEEQVVNAGGDNYLSVTSVYTDVFTGKEIVGADTVQFSVSTVTGLPLLDFVEDSVKGSRAKFGPLDDGEGYIIKAELRIDDIIYKGTDSIVISPDLGINAFSDTILMEPLSSFAILSVDIQYTDILTGVTKTRASGIVTNLIRTDGLAFENGRDTLSEKGSQVRFRQLDRGATYYLSSVFTNDSDSINYTYADTVFLSNDATTSRSIVLTPDETSYVLKGTATAIDAFSGLPIDELPGLKVVLRKENGQFFDNGMPELESSSMEFDFFGLQSGISYVLSAVFRDTATKANYHFEEMILIDSADLFNFRNISLTPDSLQSFVFGRLSAVSPLTGESVALNDVQRTLSYSNQFITPNQFTDDTSQDGRYLFGPVVRGEETTLDFKFTDDDGFMYLANTTVNANDFKLEQDLELTWQPSTVAYVEVRDSLGNPFPNAEVFVYTNYDFLTRYMFDKEAANTVGTTDDDGKLLLTDLSATRYYFLGLKVIGEDSITSLQSSSFDPESVSALQLNQVNQVEVVLDSLFTE